MERRETGRIAPVPAGRMAVDRCGTRSRTPAGQVRTRAPSVPAVAGGCGTALRTPAGQVPTGTLVGSTRTGRCGTPSRTPPRQMPSAAAAGPTAMVRIDPANRALISPGRAVRREAARGPPCGRTRRRARPTPVQPRRRVLSGAIRRRVPAGPARATTRLAASRAPTGAVPHHVPPRPAVEGTEPAAVGRGEAGYRVALHRTAQRRAGPGRPRGR
jgi:hypothetical protein